MTKKNSRNWMIVTSALFIVLTMAWAFWPRPMIVDMGEVTRQSMIVTINEEGKTRVRDAYVVSTPVAGRLLRIEVESGDQVIKGDSIIARMLPSNPSALDIRTREQARASVTSAQAAVRVARADLNKAMADKDYYDQAMKRKRKLRNKGAISLALFEQAQRDWRAANASLDQAKAAISMRQADLANARARLIGFDASPSQPSTVGKHKDDSIPLRAPISGRILRVLEESEKTLPVGKPILEIGDISNDLEIVADLLSTDAVKVSVGNRVIIRNWGREHTLQGSVIRVDPWGFTKFSALGVEEQRVKVLIKFTDPPEQRESLGHGFRVETQIVIWENKDALTIPSSALFRQEGEWVVFVVERGRAIPRPLKIGRNNGVQAEIISGLEEGNRVILFPGPGLSQGIKVTKREIN